MHIEWNFKGVAKAVGVFLLLSLVAGIVVAGGAMAIETAMPGKGYGAYLKGLFL